MGYRGLIPGQYIGFVKVLTISKNVLMCSPELFLFSTGNTPDCARMASVCCLVAVSVEKVTAFSTNLLHGTYL